MSSPNSRQPPSGRRFTALTPIALAFTAVSLCWTGWSITDLIKSGAWGILAAVSVDGLWGVVQYLSYKRIGGRVIEVVEWVTLVVACSLLAWHGWTNTPAAAFAGALPPIVAKISWVGDIRLRLLRSYDPTAPTAEQEAEINDVIRDSEYQARLKAAQIEREAAEDIAAIRAKGKVDMERLEVDFEVGIKEITTRADLKRRTPITLDDPGIEHAEPEPDPVITTLTEQFASLRSVLGELARDRTAELAPNPLVNEENQVREPVASVADLVREQIATTTDNATAVRNVLAIRPKANKESVAAAVRRERRKSQMKDGYA